MFAAIPTVGVWCKGLEEIPRCREKVEEGTKKVIYSSLEKKKKTIEETMDESEKLVKEVKKEKVADEKIEKLSEEAADEKQQVMEDQKLMAENTMVSNDEVIIQIDSSYSLSKIDNRPEQQ
ncbi:hypothetical protein Hanom_Chr08g00734921 [Helianthus anomalus]